MSIANYNAQVDAYNKSERVFERQVDYNATAADVAYQQNQISYRNDVSKQVLI